LGALEAILGFIAKYSWRAIFGLCVATFMMLRYADRFGTYDPAHSLRAVLIAGFIFSLAVLTTYPCSGAYPWISAHATDWRMIRIGKKHLRRMSNDEIQHCRWFVNTNGDSLHHSETNGALGSLLEKNILFTPGEPWGNGMRDFRIRPWALKYLKEHPELLTK